MACLAWACGSHLKHKYQRGPPVHLRLWRESVGEEEIADLMKAYAAAKSIERKKHKSANAKSSKSNKHRNRCSKLSYRLALGKSLDEWFQTPEGLLAKQEKRQWIAAARYLELLGVDDPPNRVVKQLVFSCHQQYMIRRCHAVETGQGKTVPSWFAVPDEHRCRARGTQGAPMKTAEIGNALYQWLWTTV